MPFYREHIYPHLVDTLGNPKPIADVRQRMIPPRTSREHLCAGAQSGHVAPRRGAAQKDESQG
jgi:hypothetical protein